jgi:2,3-diketo-5-methylthio-1-phosphopentane phosphatase
MDVGNEILDRFAGVEWREVDRAYIRNEIGSREAYERIASLFRATREQMLSFILRYATMDPYFGTFYHLCQDRNLDVLIVSDGLDFYIEAVLAKSGFSSIDFLSNRAIFEEEGVRIEFPHAGQDCNRCGTCKLSVIKEMRSQYERIYYVGDGYSDVCASREADLVFAKGILLEECRNDGRPCVAYKNFADITAHISRNMPGHS